MVKKQLNKNKSIQTMINQRETKNLKKVENQYQKIFSASAPTKFSL